MSIRKFILIVIVSEYVKVHVCVSVFILNSIFNNLIVFFYPH